MQRFRTPSRTLVLLLLGITGVSAWAQTKPDGQWRGTGGAALSATSGNSSTSAALLSLDMARATTADKVSLGANANYGSSKSGGVKTTTSNKLGAFGQYDFNLSPQLFAFGRLALDRDELIDLNLRTGLAGGLGYKVVDTKPLQFTLYGGAGHTRDSYDSVQTIGGKTGKTFSRSSLFLAEESAHELSATTSFKQRLELHPGLSGDKAKLLKFTSGLGVAMSSTMSLTVGLTATHNSKPPTGLKKTDTTFFTGINVKLGAN